jgi:uncharacterized protein
VIFIDTSAIYALADRADDNHARATRLFATALSSGTRLVTHSYVLVESMALIQHRLGLEHALTFANDAEAFDVDWVTRGTHERAVEWLRTAGRRPVSLVDAVSFVVMRARQIEIAFAFDPHFVRAGFRLLG